MARCSGCGGDRCSCVIQEGANVTVVGAGTSANPYVISAEAGEGGSGTLPTGSVIMFGAAVPPTGWLVANGAAVSRLTYAALFAVIGITYGSGDGSSTFALPDLAGRFPLGADGTHALGGVAGAEAVAITTAHLPVHSHTNNHVHGMSHQHIVNHDHGGVGTSTESNFHAHSGGTGVDGNHLHGINIQTGQRTNDLKTQGTIIGGGNTNTDARGDHTHTVTVGNNNLLHTHSLQVPASSVWSELSNAANTAGSSAPESTQTGQGQPFSIMPPWTGITFLIKT